MVLFALDGPCSSPVELLGEALVLQKLSVHSFGGGGSVSLWLIDTISVVLVRLVMRCVIL